MPKPLQLSLKTLTAIAEALFLAFTEEQAAALAGISKSTLKRIRQSEVWADIEQRRLAFEKPYRQKVWNGAVGWQGAAWMLERQYASQLSKPELQLAVNSSTTNNTLVITADAARELQARASVVDAQVEKLVASRQGNTASEASKPYARQASESASNGASNQASEPKASATSTKPSEPSKRKAKASQGTKQRKEASRG